jgi:hypothetical protein
MKKIVASVSLVAVSAAGLQAALLPGLTPESNKPFTVSAALRGFYDDNVSALPNNYTLGPGQHRDSYGFEVSPSVQFLFPMEQTTLSFGYTYSLKYYDNKPVDSTGHDDNSHEFNVGLNHAFSERYSISVKDSFAIGQEPDMLRAGNTFTTFQRYSGNNLRNYGTIDFAAQLTPEFGLELGYENTLYSYADNAWIDNPGGPIASTAGLLDELDHVVHLDGRYLLQPQTTGIVGVQFRETDYTADQPIGYDSFYNQTIKSGDRNARSYYGYIGVDHNFRPDLTGSIRAGGRYTDYYNNPSSQNGASPYAMASLKYTYLPESYLQVGGSYDYSPSSVFSVSDAGGLTLNAQSGTIFASVTHRIMPKLYGSVTAQFQNTTYYGGQYDNETANFYLVGLNLRYQFTPNFSAEAGYNYDDLNSQVQSNYDRNRVYIGVTGSY